MLVLHLEKTNCELRFLECLCAYMVFYLPHRHHTQFMKNEIEMCLEQMRSRAEKAEASLRVNDISLKAINLLYTNSLETIRSSDSAMHALEMTIRSIDEADFIKTASWRISKSRLEGTLRR